MHPNPRFRIEDREAMLAWVAAIGFAHIMVAGEEGPMVVHAPVTRDGDRLSFHVARANRVTPHLDGARALVSVAGADGYISPNWYVNPTNQVPTWDYLAIEAEGVVYKLDDAALTTQLDALAAQFEPVINPAAPWTRDKMDQDKFVAMRRAIVGFELQVVAVRGTIKLSQNKSGRDREGVIAGLKRAGNAALAEAIR